MDNYRRNVDIDLRRLQRQVATGDPHALYKYLGWLNRTGQLSQQRIQLLAFLGNPAALQICNDGGCQVPLDGNNNQLFIHHTDPWRYNFSLLHYLRSLPRQDINLMTLGILDYLIGAWDDVISRLPKKKNGEPRTRRVSKSFVVQSHMWQWPNEMLQSLKNWVFGVGSREEIEAWIKRIGMARYPSLDFKRAISQLSLLKGPAASPGFLPLYMQGILTSLIRAYSLFFTSSDFIPTLIQDEDDGYEIGEPDNLYSNDLARHEYIFYFIRATFFGYQDTRNIIKEEKIEDELEIDSDVWHSKRTEDEMELFYQQSEIINNRWEEIAELYIDDLRTESDPTVRGRDAILNRYQTIMYELYQLELFRDHRIEEQEEIFPTSKQIMLEAMTKYLIPS